MKVLLVTKWNCGLFPQDFSYHGEWTDNFEMSLALQKCGIQVGIVAPKPLVQHYDRFEKEFGRILSSAGIRIFFVDVPFGKAGWLMRWRLARRTLQAAHQFRPDVIQFWSTLAPFPRWLLRQIPIVNVVSGKLLTRDSYPNAQKDRAAMRGWGTSPLSPHDQFVALLARLANKLWKLDQIDQLPNRCDALVSMHKRGYQQFTDKLAGSIKLVKYIPKGVNLDAADTQKPERLKDKESELEILFVGTIYHLKGVFDLVEAFRQVRKTLPNVHLNILGNGPPKMLKQLQELIRKWNLADAVTMLGPIEYYDKWQYLWNCDVFCLPSYSDVFPSTIIEALACGKPVVTTWEIDTRAIDGESSLRVHAGDVDALAQALLKLLQDKSLRLQMGRSARAVAEANSWEHAAREYIDVYDRLVG